MMIRLKWLAAVLVSTALIAAPIAAQADEYRRHHLVITIIITGMSRDQLRPQI